MTTRVPIRYGGTGANTAEAARTSLGAAPSIAYDQANTAYGQANAARSDANTTFATINTTFGTINTNITTANSQANLAYAQANAAIAAANNANLLLGGVITGTLNVTQDIIVGGNVYLEGNTTFINVATYAVEDSLIYLASNNQLTDSVDIGFMGGKNTGGTYAHTGFVRDATDAKWKLFDGLPEEGHVGNVVDFNNTYLATLVANVEANTLSVVNGVSGNVNFDSGTLFVDSVGNRIGIATTDPAARLDIGSGNLNFSSTGQRITGNFSDATPTNRVMFQTNVLNSGTGIAAMTNGTGSSASWRLYGSSDPNNASVGDINITSTEFLIRSFSSGTGTTQPMNFSVGGTTRQMAITSTVLSTDSSINVGIGTTNPNAALHLVKDDNNNSIARFRNSNSTFRKTFIQFEDYNAAITDRFIGMDVTAGTGAGSLMFFGNSASSYQMVIDNNGNVGIGTTSPSGKLHLYNSGNSLLFIEGGAGYEAGIWFRENGVNKWEIYKRANPDDLNFYSSDLTASVMTLAAAGGVGIGTLSPAEKLHVYGNLRLFSAGYPLIDIGITTSNYFRIIHDNPNDIFAIGKNDTKQFVIIGGNGNVGIGTTSPTAKLSVRGTTDFGDSHDSTTSSLHTTRLSGYALRYDASSRYGNYGVLIFSASTGWTTSAKRFMITNGIGANKFCIIRSVDALTDPTLGDAGSITSGTADFTIDSSGSVGIGTTSPGYKLDVNGIVNIAQGSYLRKSFADNTEEFLIRGDGSAWQGFISYTPSGGTPNRGFKFGAWDNVGFRNDWVTFWNGNVGIGTTNPDQKFVVSETTTPSQISLKQETNFNLGIIGQLNFIGGGTTSKSAMIESNRVGSSATNANRGGDLRFYTKRDDVFDDLLERMRITSQGYVTTPYQPSFSAYLSETWSHPGGVSLVTGTFLTHHNTGGHYSTSTRRFTAPISGVYKFDCIIATVGGSGSFNYLSAELWVNGTRTRVGGWGCGGAGGSYGETASSFVIQLNAGDYAELACESNKTFTLQHGSTGHTIFSGYLIG